MREALTRLLAALRPWTSLLHDRLWRITDGADPRTARVMTAAGGNTAHVVRAARAPGWGSGAGVGLLAVTGWVQVVTLVTAARQGGTMDLLAGRSLLLAGLAALAADIVLRIGGMPVLALGPEGVALGFPCLATAGPHGAARLLRSRRAHFDVDAVPWADVAALVHIRTAPGRAQVGVRLHSPLPAPWPRATPAGVPSDAVRPAGFGTLLLTRDVAALDARELADLAAAAASHHPGTPLEDLELASMTRDPSCERC